MTRKQRRWAPFLAGGLAAVASAAVVARRRARSGREANGYALYATRFHLSHEALRRNLTRFVDLIDRDAVPSEAESPGLNTEAFGDFVRLYCDFLVQHHEGEDQVLFPALRRHARLRSTDAASLDRWTAEHRDIMALGAALGRAGGRVRATGRPALGELRRLAIDLEQLLEPHLVAEEELINAERLPEMIPAGEVRAIERGSARLREDGMMMAMFFIHSLSPEEQHQAFGPTPWVFRKIVLPLADRSSYPRFAPFSVTPELTL